MTSYEAEIAISELLDAMEREASRHDLIVAREAGERRGSLVLRRTLSRGRVQVVGRVEVADLGDDELDVSWSAERMRSTVRSIAEAR